MKRRKKLLINPKFQWEILTYFTIMNLMVLSVIYIVNIYALYQAGSSLDVGADPSQFLNYLRMHQQKFNITFFIGALFTTALIYILGFNISNKIAGPVYKIEKSIDAIINGQVAEKISFRKGDYFPELAEKVNQLIEFYEKKK